MNFLTSLNQTLIDALGPLGPLIAVGGLGLAPGPADAADRC